jgi:hypothetical protein
MTLPGTLVQIMDTPPARSIPTDTGVWFVTGITEKGPTDEPVACRSMQAYIDTFGDKVPYQTLYDSVDLAFHEGVNTVYVARVIGAVPVNSFAVLNDGAGTPAATMRVEAANPGAWGDLLNVEVTVGDAGGEFKLIISHDVDGVLYTSPSLATKDEAYDWAIGNPVFRLLDLGTSILDPAVVAPVSLAGGDDDRDTINDASWRAAQDLFTTDLGPGQISMPGRTTDQAHIDTNAAAEARRRFAINDFPDTATISVLTTATGAARSDGRWGAAYWPWVTIPGTAGTDRTAPPSGLVAGLIARNDPQFGPGQAPAGDWGIARYAKGLSQKPLNDTDRETLNNAGVNVIRTLYSAITVYGERTLANPASDPGWILLPSSRVMMALAARSDAAAQGFVFARVDGQGKKLSQFEALLKGVCLEFWQSGDLYGKTPDESFYVDTGAQVNTEASLQSGVLKAVISARPSPSPERVEITIVKRLITEGVV